MEIELRREEIALQREQLTMQGEQIDKHFNMQMAMQRTQFNFMAQMMSQQNELLKSLFLERNQNRIVERKSSKLIYEIIQMLNVVKN